MNENTDHVIDLIISKLKKSKIKKLNLQRNEFKNFISQLMNNN